LKPLYYRIVDAEESVVMEQLEELKRKDLIRQLDSGGFVRHVLDVKTGMYSINR
jgi:hypothetical protein